MKIKCVSCKGAGYYIHRKCGACEGKGYIKVKKTWTWISCASLSDARKTMGIYATEADATQLKLGVSGTTYGFWYR